MHPYHDGAWLFAQQNYKTDSQGLALNPVIVRTMEHVHIHVCKRNKAMGKTLGGQTIPSRSQLVPLPGDGEMYCRWVSGGPVKDFAGDVANFLANPPSKTICKDQVGAGMMTDDKGRFWACVTTNRNGPLEKVCQH
jgi:hypothetical protein